jgi:hypothetical protein
VGVSKPNCNLDFTTIVLMIIKYFKCAIRYFFYKIFQNALRIAWDIVIMLLIFNFLMDAVNLISLELSLHLSVY